MRIKEPKEQRMEEIIDAAVGVFLEKGYEGASMDLIAKKAGLSKGGLYHHFKSKDEILLAANQVYFLPILNMMEKARAEKNPVDGLKRYILNYLKHWKNHPKEMVFSFLSLAKMIADKTLWKSMAQYTSETVAFYEFMLKKGIENKLLKNHDTGSRALLLFTSLDGIIGYLIMDENLSVTGLSKDFYNIFIKELEIK
jgi:AcrR family transcriptional regulator